MKVLFAVNNDKISNAIIDKYKELYNEDIQSKNVYYFNALISEIKKDKSYDRIVISEELETFITTNYEEIDNFIFNKLDAISDEADEIDIILISTDRRAKKDPILSRFFNIGIYNVLIGADRSIKQVCQLINNPRTKKEAKQYIRLDSVNSLDSEEDLANKVSELELKNILNHYKKLGNDYSKYNQAFSNIASQYNYSQLKIIINILPKSVKDILESSSDKYKETIEILNSMELAEENKTEESVKKGKKKQAKAKLVNEAKELNKKNPVKKVTKNKSRNINKVNIPKGPQGNIVIPGVSKPVQNKSFEIKETMLGSHDGEKVINLEQKGKDSINNETVNTVSSKENNVDKDIISINKNFESSVVSNNFIPSVEYSKIVPLVGASKAGTTFLINMLAQYFSIKQIKTAILDLTTNKNMYYIYTDNKQELREIAFESLNKLSMGIDSGLRISQNLSVFTTVPTQDNYMYNIGKMFDTLNRKYSVILVDTDFNTPKEVFGYCEEIYAVQDLDVLNIQYLTSFFRELKTSNINLDKFKIVINKFIKSELSENLILDGLSNYNDPEMKFMDNLFDSQEITSYIIPFSVETYRRSIKEIVNCKLDLREYNATFINAIRTLANEIYRVTNKDIKGTSKGKKNEVDNKVENVLNKMKKNI